MLEKVKIIKDNLLYFVVILAFLITPVSNFDIFWHLKTGEYIITQQVIPKHPLFSFLDIDNNWIDHEWASQIILFGIYKIFNITGLLIFKIVIFFIIFGLVFSVLYRRVQRNIGNFLFFMACITVFSNRFIIRPEIFDYLFVAWYIFLIEKKRFELWHSVFIVIWVNLHPGFIIILPVFLLYFIFYKEKKFFIACLVTIVSGFLNPYGAELYKRLFLEVRSPFIKHFISEWYSPFLYLKHMSINLSLGLFFVLLTVVLWRIIRGLVKEQQITVLDLLTLLFGALALTSVRYISYFVLFAMLSTRNTLSKREAKKGMLMGMTCIMIALIISGFLYSVLGVRNYFGWGINKFYFSQKAIDFIRAKDLGRGRVFTNFSMGGFFSFHFYPHARVFIDGSYITNTNLNRYLEVLKNPKKIETYKVDLFFINYTIPLMNKLIRYLSQNGYRFVYMDDDFVIFLPPNRDYPSQEVVIEGAITTWAIYKKSNFLLGVNYPHLAKALILRNIEKIENTYYILNNLGVAYAALDEYDTAESILNKSLLLEPEQIDANYNLGLLYVKLKRYPQALKYLSKAYDLRPHPRLKLYIERIKEKTENFSYSAGP